MRQVCIIFRVNIKKLRWENKIMIAIEVSTDKMCKMYDYLDYEGTNREMVTV